MITNKTRTPDRIRKQYPKMKEINHHQHVKI